MKREMIETMKPAVQVGSFVGLILFTKRVSATSTFFPDLGLISRPLSCYTLNLGKLAGPRRGQRGAGKCWQVGKEV